MASLPALRISRVTIPSVEESDRARSRRDLNALRALGAVLDKRAWWTKWTTRADVREKWLHEIDALLVDANVRQVAAVWPYNDDVERGEYETLLSSSNDGEIQKVLEHVQYPPAHFVRDGFEHGTYYESDDELEEFRPKNKIDADNSDEKEEFYDKAALHDDFSKVYRHHTKQNAYGQLMWYVMMASARRWLLALPLEQWTRAQVIARLPPANENEEDLKQTIKVILAVVRDARPCSLDVIRSHFPDERRKNVLRLLLLHFEKIHFSLHAAKRDICAVLKMLSDRALDTPSGSPFYIPGPVPQTWLSDDAVADETRRKFCSGIAVLEDVPDDEKDWHPMTNNQVLNVVHPSLFCGVIGTTPVVLAGGTSDVDSTATQHLRSIMFAKPTGVLDGPASTKFQWLPSELDVSDDGATTIRTYINNLHPEQHASLYDSIAAIFTRFVPLFDRVLSTLDDAHIRIPYKLHRWYPGTQRRRDPDARAKARIAQALTNELGAPPSTSLRRWLSPGFFEMDAPRFTLRGRRCQVIVKIAEIVLTPESPEYTGGSWHIEGTDAERIIATGLYYVACDNISESRLSFRTFVQPPEYEQSDHVGIGLTSGLQAHEPLVQHLGSVSALGGRCVVFPNIYQHKVEPFHLVDRTRPGVRKVLAFFLVDPTDEPIPSTATVAPQQQEWIARAHEPALKRLRLPDTVVTQIQDLSREGTSLDEAKRLRLELMDERSPVLVDDHAESLFSLCEH